MLAWILGVFFFLVLPGMELWLLLGGLHLAVVTLLCMTTGAVGWWFARREGLDLWSELESDVANGRLPTHEGVDAMLMLAGAWAMILPGLLTDLLGVALLVPVVRSRAVPIVRNLVRQYLL